MSWWIAAGIRGAMTKTVAAVALYAMAWAGVAAPASADDLPTGPNDPQCATMSWYAACQGGPFAPHPAPAPAGAPTGPLDPQCATMPADAACLGSPYVPQPPPPPVQPVQPLGGPPAPIAPPPMAPIAPIAPPPMEPPHIDTPDMTGGMGHI